MTCLVNIQIEKSKYTGRKMDQDFQEELGLSIQTQASSHIDWLKSQEQMKLLEKEFRWGKGMKSEYSDIWRS